MGVDYRDVAPVTNATGAVNAVVRSLHLGRGDLLLMATTTYNAVKSTLAEVGWQGWLAGVAGVWRGVQGRRVGRVASCGLSSGGPCVVRTALHYGVGHMLSAREREASRRPSRG
jgi:hypothetical protein